MIKHYKKRIWVILLLVVEITLSILGFLSMIDTISFVISKKDTYAEAIKIDELKMPNPYKITLSYFNEYENKFIISYIDNIDGNYGEKLRGIKRVKIYYGKYFPKEIYLTDYKYPNGGYIILNVVFLFIMLVAVFFQYKTLKGINIGQNIKA